MEFVLVIFVGFAPRGLVPRLHDEPLALLIVQLELHNGLGLGRLCVGCLDIAKVLSAGAEN